MLKIFVNFLGVSVCEFLLNFCKKIQGFCEFKIKNSQILILKSCEFKDKHLKNLRLKNCEVKRIKNV